MNEFLKRWGAAIGMMAVIFTASSFSKAQVPQAPGFVLDWLVKKTAHVLTYGLLGAACLRGLAYGRADRPRDLMWAVLLSGLYGVTDEFHQAFVPGRGAAALDVGIDTLGAALGVWLALRRRPPPAA